MVSIFYFGSKIWNDLNQDIKASPQWENLGENFRGEFYPKDFRGEFYPKDKRNLKER